MSTTISQNKAGGLSPTQTAPTSPSARNWRLNATKNALLITYSQILVKGNKHYCGPRPDTTIDLLERFHDIKIKRRWFFQAVLDLELAGFLTRKRLPRHMPDNTVHSKPSLWSLTIKGAQYLVSKAVKGAKELVSAMIDWVHRGDRRFPGPSNIFPGEEITERSTALARLQELIKPIGFKPAGGGSPAPT